MFGPHSEPQKRIPTGPVGDPVERGLTLRLLNYGSTAVAGTIAIAMLTSFVAWDHNAAGAVAAWLGVSVGVALIRAWFLVKGRAAPTTQQEQRWCSYYLSLTVVSAVLWGIASLGLFPLESGSDQTLFVILVAGVSAVASQTLFASTFAVNSMILLPTLPIAWHFLVPVAGSADGVGALVVALFCVILMRLSSNSHGLLCKTLTYEYETQQLIEQSEGLICTHDQEGTLLSVNQATSSALGYQPEDMVGRPLSEFMSGRTKNLFGIYLKAIWEQGKGAGHLELVCANGDRQVWSFKNKLYTPASGEAYVIGHAQDVTESVRLERWLRETIDLLPAEFSRFDPAGKLVLMNDRFGTSGAEIELGLPYERVLAAQAGHNPAVDWVDEMLEGLEHRESLVSDQRRSDTQWVSVHAQRSVDGSIVQIGTDISHSKQLEHELRDAERQLEARVIARTEELQASQADLSQSEARLTDYAKTAADYYWELDANLVYRHILGRFEELTGLSSNRAVGTCIADLWQGHVVDPEELERKLRKTVMLGRSFTDAELRWQHPDGGERVMHISGQPFYSHAGEVIGYRGSGHDVTELTHLAERLEFEANHDALTGLYNRREFERTLSSALEASRVSKSEHVLGYVDLDRFKIINDTCGHMAGDELLRQLGTLMQSTLDGAHTVARLGGDEFGVLLNNCSLERGKAKADILLRAIESFRFSWDDQQFAVGASIGLVPVTAESGGLANILQSADVACYAAKSNGRNRVVVHEQGDNLSAERREEVKLISQVVAAIDRDELLLTVQPIMPSDLSGNLYDHFEILVAMTGSDGEILRAGKFMELSERYGLAVRIDQWVVGGTLDWLAAHPEVTEEPIMCAINLSGASLGDPSMAEFVKSKLQSSGVDASKLCFEITETSAISNWQQALTLINMIREFGCQFALDDFGTGLSSFAYLKKLPVDIVKIDGAFVTGIVADATNMAIVKSICEVARSTGKKTIAEFVDNTETAALLASIGVDYVQGYGIGFPQPIDVLATDVAQRAQRRA